MEKDPKEVFQKDVRQGIFVWAVLEAVCFWALPFAGVYAYDEVANLLIPTVVMGPIGAVVVASCSSVMVVAEGLADPKKKQTQITIAQLISVVGFVALAFPLLLAGLRFAQAISETNWDELFINQPTEDKVLE